MSQGFPDLSSTPPDQVEGLLNGPALNPPHHQLPNFVDPPNLNTLARTVVGFGVGICSIFVVGRLYVILEDRKKLYLADGILLFGFGTYIAYSVIILDSTNHIGYLIHQWDLRLRDVIYLVRSFTIGYTIFAISSAAIKTAIILEWLRIFNQPLERNNFFWLSHGIIWVNISFHFIAVICFNASCKPYTKTWDPFLRGTCYDIRPVYVAATTAYLIVDIFILVLPQRIIWRLHMSKKKKRGVAVFFAVGVLAILSVGIRLGIISFQMYQSADHIYTLYILGLVVIVEAASGIIIYCVPSAPKAVVLLQDKLSWLKRVGNRNQEYDNNSWPISSDRTQRLGQRGGDIEQLALATIGTGDTVGSFDSPLATTALGQQPCRKSGILRTTVFTAVSEHTTSPYRIDGDQFDNQHPWSSISER